jgi:hypothetical protein
MCVRLPPGGESSEEVIMAGRGRLALWLTAPLVLTAVLAVAAAGKEENRRIAQPEEKRFPGTVLEVKQQECDICKCIELLVVLKTGAGRFEVRLGPKAFFEEHDFALSRGDRVTVTGIRFVEREKEIVLANEVRKGGARLVLRGKYGKPAWLEAHGHTCPVCGN